jgi:hypothetical protein
MMSEMVSIIHLFSSRQAMVVRQTYLLRAVWEFAHSSDDPLEREKVCRNDAPLASIALSFCKESTRYASFPIQASRNR